jgi:hypothetical protein
VTDALGVAFAAAIPPTLMALAAIIVSLRNGRKTDAVTAQIDAKTGELTAGQDAIHVLVNSNLEKVKADLAAAIAEIAELKQALKALAPHHPHTRRSGDTR